MTKNHALGEEASKMENIGRQVFLIERGKDGSRSNEFLPEEVDRVVARAKRVLLELLEEGWNVYEIFNIGTLLAEPGEWLVKLGRQESND